MNPDNVYDWAKAIGVLGAILFGGFAVFSPSWVWFRRSLFGWGSAVLCGFGTVLLVSPIFRNIQFVVDTQKVELKLSALESQISQVNASVASITANLDKSGTVTTASVNELNAKLQGIQKSVAVFETAISNVSSLGDQIKGVEKVAAEIDKNAKALNLIYLTGAPPTFSHDSDGFTKTINTAQDSKWIFDTGYPSALSNKETIFLPPSKETLPQYNKLMKALAKVPEYQEYLDAAKKTDAGMFKWGRVYYRPASP